MRFAYGMMALIALAACGAEKNEQPAKTLPAVEPSGPVPPAASVTDVARQPARTDAWIGRWTGPEGLFLVIAKGDAPGRYALTIKGDLDSKGDAVKGVAQGDTIRFERAGKAETLRASDGAGTGLKWLAEKKDCLVVQQGEGFCRD